MVCQKINYPIDKIIYDERIGEATIDSSFIGKDKTDFKKYYNYDFLDKHFKTK
jgi:hypothetical protein